MSKSYGRIFYEVHRAGSRRSAEVILPIVFDLVRPRSVVDVGCGVGTWLAVCSELGARDVLGIDGDHVDRAMLRIPADAFMAADLLQPIQAGRRFDLVLCLEVAEHVPPGDAAALVELLAGLGPVVLFSAAIPLQGGRGHVNEQWPSYWAGLFGEKGYAVIDCIRPKVWSDRRVNWWYAQNILLFASREAIERSPTLMAAHSAARLPLDLVHPDRYLRAAMFWRRLRAVLWVELPLHLRAAARLLWQTLRRS